MTTLRQLIDGKTLFAAFPPTKPPAAKPPGFLDTAKPSAGAPSPAANHVASHLNDPFGQTKDDLDQLNQKKMEYEQLKNQMAMKLAPVESVTRGIRNMHEIDDPLANPYDVDPLQDPNNPNNGMTPSNLPPGQSAAPGTAPMSQMNNMRPSQTGFAPGKATGFSGQQVVPPKMGMPQPGQANSGTVAGNPSQPAGWGQPNNMAPQAPKPPGAGQLPGAKGPGDPKVAGPVKKAQNASNKAGTRPIKIQVHADRSASPAHTTLSQAAGIAALRSACKGEDEAEEMNCCDDEYPVGSKRYATKKVTAYGTSEGVRKGWESRQRGQGGDKTATPKFKTTPYYSPQGKLVGRYLRDFGRSSPEGWFHHSTRGESRPYHIYEGAGTRGGQWKVKEATGRNREVQVFNSLAEAHDHIDNSQK